MPLNKPCPSALQMSHKYAKFTQIAEWPMSDNGQLWQVKFPVLKSEYILWQSSILLTKLLLTLYCLKYFITHSITSKCHISVILGISNRVMIGEINEWLNNKSCYNKWFKSFIFQVPINTFVKVLYHWFSE